ncbi:MAG: hypothetical protein JSR41_24670 [Proteobacteria bacterium]|nr:hypothetical protein [Pseudomonadota bacterium]
MAQKWKFSPSTLGWYLVGVDYPNAPADLREVPAALREELLGKQIEAAPDGMPREYVPPPFVPVPPRSVTMRQARLALLEAGHLAAVNAAIAAMPRPSKEAAQIEWEFAANVERNSPFLGSLSSALGMDEDQLDQLFLLAASK